MKQQLLVGMVGAAVLAVSPIHGKESGEKSGTADINIGVGELKGSKSRPGNSLKQPVPTRPAKPQAGAPGLEKMPAKPTSRDGNPDRPVIRGSVPNPTGNNGKSSGDAIIKGKKILQN